MADPVPYQCTSLASAAAHVLSTYSQSSKPQFLELQIPTNDGHTITSGMLETAIRSAAVTNKSTLSLSALRVELKWVSITYTVHIVRL